MLLVFFGGRTAFLAAPGAILLAVASADTVLREGVSYVFIETYNLAETLHYVT